jgi:DNA-binding CsgD family transcriptional regulator
MASGGMNSYLETKLTISEIEVVKLLCKEYSTKEIGELMNISDRTVESHKHNIFKKTGAKNLAGIVAFAFRNRIVS